MVALERRVVKACTAARPTCAADARAYSIFLATTPFPTVRAFIQELLRCEYTAVPAIAAPRARSTLWRRVMESQFAARPVGAAEVRALPLTFAAPKPAIKALLCDEPHRMNILDGPGDQAPSSISMELCSTAGFGTQGG